MTDMTVRKQSTENLTTDGLTKQFLVECLAELEQRFDGKLEAMGQQFDGKLEAMGQRFDGKLEAMEKRGDVKFDGLHQKIDDAKMHLEGRIDWYRQDTKEHTESLVKGVAYQLGQRMERLESKVDAIGTAVIETGRKVREHDDDIVKLKASVVELSQ